MCACSCPSDSQLKEAILKLLGEEGYAGAKDLEDEEVAGLLACLPSEVRSAWSGPVPGPTLCTPPPWFLPSA